MKKLKSVPPESSEHKNHFENVDRRLFLKTAATAAAGAIIAPSGVLSDHDWLNPLQQRYPDPSIVVLDKRFEKYWLSHAAVERLWTGARWAEGPVWFGDGRFLLFSDIPDNRIFRWTEETGEVSVFRSPSNYANGNTRDRQGRLITCEHDLHRITRTEHNGTITVLIDQYQGKKLNAPNDVAVHSNGSIWFTDPGYGILSNYEGHVDKFELPTNVYRLDPFNGTISVVADDMIRPNGLCFSPDEKLLYIVDAGQPQDKPQPIKVYDVVDGMKLANARLFCDMGKGGGSDGIRCDIDGNLWAAAGNGVEGYDGVHIFTPEGSLIGKICLPEQCANLCFGGEKRNRLFMTASQSLYALYVNTQGAQMP